MELKSSPYYDTLFKENRDEGWNDAPGKKVVLSAFSHLVKNQSNVIVDIGCGNGYFLNEIRKHNVLKDRAWRYWGIDISQRAVEKAVQMYRAAGTFLVMDVSDMKFENEYFTVVLSYETIEHVQNPTKALTEIHRTLRNGGLFLMMVPSLDYYRSDRSDEGWHEDCDVNKQLQWNYLRKTWEKMFLNAGLKLLDVNESQKYGAIKSGVFFFGFK